MFTLSPAQTSHVIDLIADALRTMDEEISTLSEAVDREDVDSDEDQLADLIEDHEQAHRLRERLVAALNGQPSPIWECADQGCAWLNPMDQTTCEQCGLTRPPEEEHQHI